jgi:hypothetical protein
MSHIIKFLVYPLFFALLSFSMAGCGSSSSSSDALHTPDEGHPAGWLHAHGAEHLADNNACTECHGADLKGGISNVSCFSASFDGVSCHAGGPVAHALPFTDPALHGPVAKADLKVCQTCHSDDPTGGPGSNPRFNVGIGNLTNGCEDCHNTNTAHRVPWIGVPLAERHPTAGNMANACPLCHGANLGGPADGGVGPACGDCHTEGSPLTNTNCTSCHGEPPVDCDEATGTCT